MGVGALVALAAVGLAVAAVRRRRSSSSSSSSSGTGAQATEGALTVMQPTADVMVEREQPVSPTNGPDPESPGRPARGKSHFALLRDDANAASAVALQRNASLVLARESAEELDRAAAEARSATTVGELLAHVGVHEARLGGLEAAGISSLERLEAASDAELAAAGLRVGERIKVRRAVEWRRGGNL